MTFFSISVSILASGFWLLAADHWFLAAGANNNAFGLRIASLEAILAFEVGGALRFRLEAKAETSEFLPLTSNLRPNAIEDQFFASNLKPNALLLNL
jgi:hypothetical protein